MNAIRNVNIVGLASLFAITLASGCYTINRVPALSAEQVVDLSKVGKSADEIITKIRETGTVYFLKSGQVRELLDKGVEETVVDYMLETRIEAEKARAQYDYGPHYYYHRPYGFHSAPYDQHSGFHYRYCD
jgi:hypothetical protein